MNAVHRSRGGGRMKAGTLISSTRISQSTNNARKNNTGSATFFQENFTALYSAPTLMERSYPVKKTVRKSVIRSEQSPQERGPISCLGVYRSSGIRLSWL